MKWAERASERIGGLLTFGLVLCLLVSLGISFYVMMTEVWRESWNYCDVHFGEKKFGDVRWRGEGAFCTPAPLSSLVLFSVMAGLLLLPLYACFVSVVAVVLALFSNPAQRRSGRV